MRGLVNKNLSRDDLFFRLNVIKITVPPLRERMEDIAVLITHFAKKFAEETGNNAPFFSHEVVKVFMEYS